VDNKKNEPKTDNGRADFIKADNESYNSLDYAKDMGRIITSKGINLVFIDFQKRILATYWKKLQQKRSKTVRRNRQTLLQGK